MLSKTVRLRLFIALVLLVTIHIWVLPPSTQVAADKKVLKQVDALIEDQNYAGAINLIEASLKLRSDKNVEPLLSRLEKAKKLNASAEAYFTAMTFYNKGDMAKALSNFKQVIPEDVANFTDARTKICQLGLDITSDRIKEQKASGSLR